MINNDKIINEALERDLDLSREEYEKKAAEADKTTAAHGIEGEAPLTEAEREARMRMNYYGISLNLFMNILAALDDVAERITVLNNNIVTLTGGEVNDGCNASD